ncbi:MAG: KUP/HAK/KT family potassium transporter, partial [Chitinophagaceae bacterium]|nr:KUP/HAK/KT family potassium transporter [Chitinophagaceae bacterium]
MSVSLKKATPAGLLIALGIIFGDIGTSPLYVLNATTNGKVVSEELILGVLSCIIWTLTLQTTIKYVVLTLRADNKGEGGIFSLYALVRRRKKWLVIPAMAGGAALLADGMITPPISVTSAIEGLKQIPALSHISQWTIVYIVIAIISVLFFLQQFGTALIGRFFGPVMLIWFFMLASLGLIQMFNELSVLKAFNP